MSDTVCHFISRCHQFSNNHAVFHPCDKSGKALGPKKLAKQGWISNFCRRNSVQITVFLSMACKLTVFLPIPNFSRNCYISYMAIWLQVYKVQRQQSHGWCFLTWQQLTTVIGFRINIKTVYLSHQSQQMKQWILASWHFKQSMRMCSVCLYKSQNYVGAIDCSCKLSSSAGSISMKSYTTSILNLHSFFCGIRWQQWLLLPNIRFKSRFPREAS